MVIKFEIFSLYSAKIPQNVNEDLEGDPSNQVVPDEVSSETSIQ